MRILLVETTRLRPVSPLFYEAMLALSSERGIRYSFFDEAKYQNRLRFSLLNRIGYRMLGKRPFGYWALNRDLLSTCRNFDPDLILIVKGAHISPKTLQRIKSLSNAMLVNFATDDPFNRIVSTRDLVQGIKYYDLYLSTKRAILGDILDSGAKRVEFLPFAYKPEVHYPEKPASLEERNKFNTDVVFIGGASEDRVPYFEELIRELPHVSLSLFGGYWQRYPRLRRFYKGMALGRDFRLALGGAKIAINLVRRANRDGHVMRTFEIPACRAFMLAERTTEHMEMFSADIEASFFSTPPEMVQKIAHYLHADKEREASALAGHRRVTTQKNTYKDRLNEILTRI